MKATTQSFTHSPYNMTLEVGQPDPAVIAFFAKKKNKKNFKNFTGNDSNQAASPSDVKVETEEVTASQTGVSDGWVEIDATKKSVIKTSGKTLATMEEVQDDGEMDQEVLEKEEAKNAFHWARKQRKTKAVEPPAPAAPTGWRDRMNARENASMKLQMNSAMHFPSLGADAALPGQQVKEPTRVSTNNLWNTFEEDNDSEDEEDKAKKVADQAKLVAEREAYARDRAAEQKQWEEERKKRQQEKQREVEARAKAAEAAFQKKNEEAKRTREARKAEEEAKAKAAEEAAKEVSRFDGVKKKKKKKKATPADWNSQV